METPSFMPLLNSIAVNERKGGLILNAWANATPDAELAGVLRFVAIREEEHAMAFTKRMCELGHAVCEDTAFQVFKDFDKQLAYIGSKATDAEKITRSRGKRDSAAEAPKDPFAGFFKDTSIDPITGELLGRYICEERDSGRRLSEAYDRACAASMRNPEIEELRACVAALQSEVAKLSGLRSVA